MVTFDLPELVQKTVNQVFFFFVCFLKGVVGVFTYVFYVKFLFMKIKSEEFNCMNLTNRIYGAASPPHQ